MKRDAPMVFAIGAMLTLLGVLPTLVVLGFDSSIMFGSGVFVVLLWFWAFHSSRRKTRLPF